MLPDQQFAMFAPSATTTATAARRSTAIQSEMKKPEIEKRLFELRFTTMILNLTEFAAKIKADRQTRGPLVSSTGFTAEE
ncbi:tripartite-type tricarboxylate transporter receptor subunit TctC [Ottowia thiooxydans]|uniref:Tripartite-type tricarboxylate transporter receptor subunit TctC n=2 Tax=Ottowia thiooxydans TaxID=219182 RepID=A0ABV2QG27_9BURK